MTDHATLPDPGPAASGHREGALVVVADDGTPTGRRAVEYASWVCERLGGRLEVVRVRRGSATDIPSVDPLLAQAERADLLVVTDLTRPAPGAHLTPTAAACVTGARCAVLVVHAGDPLPPDDRPAELVVGVDGSRASSRALAWADRLTRGHDDDLDSVTVLGAPEWVFLPGHRRVDDDVEAALDGATHALVTDPRVRVQSIVEHGDPVRVLVRRSQFADLVVVGTHRHHAEDGSAVSVGLRCAAEAHAPVLVVH